MNPQVNGPSDSEWGLRAGGGGGGGGGGGVTNS